jgi:hypothetical protein
MESLKMNPRGQWYVTSDCGKAHFFEEGRYTSICPPAYLLKEGDKYRLDEEKCTACSEVVDKPPPYYVERFGRKCEIDFQKGLGRFLRFSGVLENRLNSTGDPDYELKIEPGMNYRLYYFDGKRFEYTIWFDSDNARVDHARRLVFRKFGGREECHTYESLGICTPDPRCLSKFLSAMEKVQKDDRAETHDVGRTVYTGML